MKIYFGKDIPQLNSPQCSVVQAESSTGIILTVEGERYIQSNAPYILIFNSFKDAKEFSEKKVIEEPNIECNIYDYSAKFIERIIT